MTGADGALFTICIAFAPQCAAMFLVDAESAGGPAEQTAGAIDRVVAGGGLATCQQKVEGSSPFSRFARKPSSGRVFLCQEVPATDGFRSALPLGATSCPLFADLDSLLIEQGSGAEET
jgi:hypothetical protein